MGTGLTLPGWFPSEDPTPMTCDEDEEEESCTRVTHRHPPPTAQTSPPSLPPRPVSELDRVPTSQKVSLWFSDTKGIENGRTTLQCPPVCIVSGMSLSDRYRILGYGSFVYITVEARCSCHRKCHHCSEKLKLGVEEGGKAMETGTGEQTPGTKPVHSYCGSFLSSCP
ncbi:hypothetical protein CB1_000394036 [Camelus ferus]|nr:hypothetical protein CB1_000394036 [Camelus ferus]